MTVEKVSGHIVGAQLTNAEQKALDIEIRKQIVEYDRGYWENIEKAVLYVLHEKYNFGKQRLYDFWKSFLKIHDDLISKYEMPDDFDWLVDHKLKDLGIDVHEWNEQELRKNGE